MRELIEQGRRLAGKPLGTRIETVLHPGGRGDRGFVTVFLYDRGQPFCLAKVPRVHNSLTQTEADNLAAVAAALGDSPVHRTVDQALGTATIEGRVVLFKKLLAGNPSSRLLGGREADVLHTLRATTDWLLSFIAATKSGHRHDERTKRAAAEAITSPGGDRSWIETFVNGDAHFVGPSHGDLVPANVLFDGPRLSGVVDFENYSDCGLPYADFVGLIVSIGVTRFGRGAEMIDMTFRTKSWFSDAVAGQVKAFCAQTGSSVEDFIDLLPMYSDRALNIASTWSLPEQHEFQLRLRDFFVSDTSSLETLLR